MAKGKSGSRRAQDQPPAESDTAATLQTPEEPVAENKRSFAVVGLGASAGGLEAFKQFFTAMPAESGLAFVLIQHLDPTHVSLTDELLSKQTRMRVVQATDEMRVEPNHVYVIPPNKNLAISGETLHLTELSERRGLRLPIDFFFRSLAEDQQQRAIGIVLSGTGTDGTQGVREIKAAGGLVMAQSPETAQHDGMPRSAIAAGVVDYAVPIDQMPSLLQRYVRHGYVNGGDSPAPEKATDQMQAIVSVLRARLKYDFSCYKKGTLTRRVQRRMSSNHIEKMSDYVEFLRENKEEVTALYKGLLINVTNFFREPEAWSELEQQVITPLVRDHDDLPIRVWTPGCATGEEPYSVIMLLLERLQAADKACGIQIFASDIDQDALALARSGIYPESIVADVSAERLRRFFIKGEHTYRINKEIRDAVVFAEQNLISDPPFSKLDLICCRNLLIYLEPAIQKKIFTLFHFALREGGFLFLGNSETVGQQSDLFEPVSRKWRIYRRIGPVRHDKLELPSRPANIARFTPQAAADLTDMRVRRIAGLAQHLMLQRFAPACVLINRKAEVLYLNGAVDEFLQLPSGELAIDLFALAREGLRTKLRAAVHQVIEGDQPVVVDGVRIKRSGKYASIRIIVEPLRQPKEAEGLLLVRFEAEGDSSALSTIPEPEETARELAKSDETEPIIRQLEDELRVTREDLQSSIEELETSNEEFKAANEEVTSINEELQSTNEELETSKEELQSLNEELQTVNSQLEQKVHDLETSNNDLANLLSSTEIATIFLDRQFRIKRFTPAATRLLRVIDSDQGRSISDLVMNVNDDGLLAEAEAVLQHLTPIEKEVQDTSQHSYLRRIVPYRTHDNRIDGVVITFVDITRKNRDAQSLRDSEARYRTVVEGSPDGIVIQQDSRIVYANPTMVSMFGYASAENLIGLLNLETLAAPEERAALRARIEDCYRGEHVPPHLGWRGLKQDGSEVWIASNAAIIRWQDRPAILETCADITEVRHSAELLKQTQLRQRSIIDSAIDAVIQMDHVGRITDFNTAAERLFGHARADVMGKPLAGLIIPPALREAHYTGLAHYLATGEGPALGKLLEMSALRADGSEFPVELSIASIPGSEPPAFTGFLRDITQRNRDQTALREAVEQLGIVTDTMSVPVTRCNRDLTYRWVSKPYADWRHLAPEDIIGRPIVEVLGQEAFDKLRPHFDEVLSGQVVRYEEQVNLLGIGLRWIKATYTPIFDARGTVEGWVAVVLDIDDVKRAEQILEERVAQRTQELQTANAALLESEQKFRTFVESAPDAIVVADESGLIVQVNQRTEELFGYPREDLLGHSVEWLVPPRLSKAHREHRTKFFRSPTTRQMGLGQQLVAMHKDGSEIPVDIKLSPLTLDDRTLVMASVRDVTERQKAKDFQFRFGAIMESSSAAIVMLALDGTITHWNRGAQQLFGYQATEVVGKDIRMLLPPEHSEDYREITARLTAGEAVEEFETVRLHKDGSRIDVALTASFLKNESGQPIGLSVIKHDIRERKRLEKQIAEVAETERQYWSRELHDSLGQEVSAIGMLATSLKQQLPGESSQTQLADQLATAIDQTKQNMRRFAKGLFPVAVDASGLRVALRELAQEINKFYQLDCRFECPNNISLEDNYVATQLFMIVREAAHNAAKHAKPSQIVIRLDDGDGMRVSIRDDGIGLPRELDETATMGLRSIRHRCGLIGASLQIETPPEGGTIISCRIPAKRGQ